VLTKTSAGTFLQILEDIMLERISSTMDYVPSHELLPSDSIVATLATTPQRNFAMVDVILSVYPFVDQIRVFAHGHELSVDHPVFESSKVTVLFSADHDHQGDLAKFFWIDSDRHLFKYHMALDDDILYPMEYAKTMLSILQNDYNNNVIIGVQGLKLRQPLLSYTDPPSRTTMLFYRPQEFDVNSHLIGTGTVLYRFDKFGFKYDDMEFYNMADVWLAEKAQDFGLPRVSIKRRAFWICEIEGTHSSGIWSSITNSSKKLIWKNSLFAQDRVIKDKFPLYLVPLGGKRLKIFFSVLSTTEDVSLLDGFIKSYLNSRSLNHDWSFTIITSSTSKVMDDFLNGFGMHDHVTETFIIRSNASSTSPSSCNLVNEALNLASRQKFDYGFVVTEQVKFSKKGWDLAYLDALKSGYSLLAHSLQSGEKVSGTNVMAILPSQASQNFFGFSSNAVLKAGFCDLGISDLLLRYSRVKSPNSDLIYDVPNSQAFFKVHGFKSFENKAQLDLNKKRLYVHPPSHLTLQGPKILYPFGYNYGVDRVKVLNMDTETERLKIFSRRAAAAGIEFSREPGINVSIQPFASMYEEYSSQPLFKTTGAVRRVTGSFQLYRDYDSQSARLEFVENRDNRKSLTKGGYGYSIAFMNALASAVVDGIDTLLMFDDDAMFHKDFQKRFPLLLQSLPDDWMLFYLGAIQYHWDEDYIQWYGRELYYSQGTAIGSHAVLIKKSAFLKLLRIGSRLDMPIDDGALSALCAQFPKRCLVAYPNLVIQDSSLESTIKSSKNEGAKRNKIFRWNVKDYAK
jgi:GR25 family glycosyltransferase involved in LPS biosynthesis